jgi:hypothetical protein
MYLYKAASTFFWPFFFNTWLLWQRESPFLPEKWRFAGVFGLFARPLVFRGRYLVVIWRWTALSYRTSKIFAFLSTTLLQMLFAEFFAFRRAG